MDEQLQRRQTAEVARQPVNTIGSQYGGQELAVRGERAAGAVAAREEAMVKARFVMAYQRPRDVMDFRSRLLHECERSGFAEVAMYKRPVGKEFNKRTGRNEEKFAEGPSIRMIETALQLYRNVQASSTTVYDDEGTRIIKVFVIDLELNTSFEQEITLLKTIEKRGYNGQPPQGREVLGQRLNSNGDPTFLVTATDDEVIVKQASAVSKAIRTCGQRLLPRDVIEEAIALIKATVEDEVRRDPDAEKKKLADAFFTLAVTPSDMASYLGHSLDRVTPTELVKLREIYRSIKSGESTWEEYQEAANTTPDPALQQEVRERLLGEAETAKNARTATQMESTPQAPIDPADPTAPPTASHRRGFK